ncbi:hypothetical protein AMK26_27230 [Streptomyces sp. CB03234]|uniref:lipoprotein n=1 Tax=Streptomyces sp. (strain CB03234) TaxID=1703937 RepID=UPI0009398102|nr:lipoprotein [Streptomyces sp. CB03234]OKJ99695.1 hypothetical protein AMK26_27230 [Streptomyces sp. CB03234]
MGRYGVARGVVVAVAVGAGLVGCSSEPVPANAAGAEPSATATATATAVKGVVIGGKGTPCVLPVSFETAPKWTAEAVTTEFGTLDQGPVALACEIDAKPAGNIGFLRVWTGDAKAGGTPRAVLEGFVTADENAGQARYSEVTAGALPAAEVTYTVKGESQDGPKTERALAVTTPRGAVVVHLGGLDSEEHREMLPAFELAKKTMAVTAG